VRTAPSLTLRISSVISQESNRNRRFAAALSGSEALTPLRYEQAPLWFLRFSALRHFYPSREQVGLRQFSTRQPDFPPQQRVAPSTARTSGFVHRDRSCAFMAACASRSRISSSRLRPGQAPSRDCALFRFRADELQARSHEEILRFRLISVRRLDEKRTVRQTFFLTDGPSATSRSTLCGAPENTRWKIWLYHIDF
jgi:hypothetical protein